ncbi:MAG: 2,5-diamino-6-(ribosylamino)-4(3H)-pyrimidinone 5'-phosphate reductase [Trizodia sp. TS-e1964]|nr:MAG: 2,5-diamino-6-(ribosylamino)-4(3H)-pyrimidinone 5'-phosphate reductase [Trizodia sp. TS-e1964]
MFVQLKPYRPQRDPDATHALKTSGFRPPAPSSWPFSPPNPSWIPSPPPPAVNPFQQQIQPFQQQFHPFQQQVHPFQQQAHPFEPRQPTLHPFEQKAAFMDLPAPHSAELHFSAADAHFLTPYMQSRAQRPPTRPHITLTYATSLDAGLALAPGRPTALSGPQAQAMTHFLRARHDGLLIGVGTALADDPGLNCRLACEPHLRRHNSVRPIVVDPNLRWAWERAKVVRLAAVGEGLAPWIVVGEGKVPGGEARARLEEIGGRYVVVERRRGRAFGGSQEGLAWENIFLALGREGLGSVMVEGGAKVINALLRPECASLVDTVIITIAPVWLGDGAVKASPEQQVARDGRHMSAGMLLEVSWHSLGQDAVLCGRLDSSLSVG